MKILLNQYVRHISFLAVAMFAPNLSAQATATQPSNQKAKTAQSPTTEDRTTSAQDATTSPTVPVYFETWTFYFDTADRNAATIYFDNGSATLSQLEKNRLRDWVNLLQQDNRSMVSAVVASWSDKPYPTKVKETLSKADRDLADRRNENIRDVLRGAGLASVDVFSMAERPNWFQRTFATDSAQIKGEAKDKQWDEKNEERLHTIFNRRGGPSKSVVIFRPGNASTLSGR